MTNAGKIVVGLDIGTTKVCVVVGQLTEYDKINVLGIGKADCDGVQRGEVVNVGKTAEAIRKAVAGAETQSHISINRVHVGIAGEHIRGRTEKGIITLTNSQEITTRDVERLSEEIFKINVGQGSQIIHALPQEYKVDSHSGVKDPIGMSGVRLECNYHIVTANQSSIRNIQNCVKNTNLEIEDIVLQPLASSYAVLSEEEMDAGVCLVDIGGGTTDLAIFQNGIVRHTAVIPIGGNIITSDIKKGCSIMPNQAEALKTRYGAAYAEKGMEDEIISISGAKDRTAKEIRKYTLAKIIEARVEELAEFVLKEIYQAGYFKNLVAGIILTGGGALLHNIHNLFTYVTGMETHIGHPALHLAQGMVEETNSPMFATATGLVMYGFNNPSRYDKWRIDTQQSTINRGNGTFPNPSQGQNSNKIIDNIKRMFESVNNTMTRTID